MTDPLINQTLSNFRVERLLAHGGMASVYYGQDIKLHRPVAIKVIDARYKDHPDYAQRFINEARLMAKWHHENIVQIYYADDKPVSYFVMEHIDGFDLSSVMAQYVDQGELMPIADVVRIGRAIANALDYAHKQGVIHRDVKPSNVLIANDQRVLLSDFGMAMDMRDGSMGNIFGTPHYISPEQARRSADAVPQSDIYSLGVILYEILTGVVPFDDASPASVALAHISTPPPLPRAINPGITRETEVVLLKVLSKDPQARYQSGAKLIEALENALTSTPSASKLELPPLPAGVPTIRRSDTSVSSLTRRGAVKPLAHHEVKSLTPTARAQTPAVKPKRNLFVPILLVLLLLIGGWFSFQKYSAPIKLANTATKTPAPPTATVMPARPTQTESPPSPIPSPIPTETIALPTDAPTLEASPTPSTTQTASTTATSSTTPTLQTTPTTQITPTILTSPTVRYPNGNHFTLFYNESSLIMLNRSRTTRGVNGFHFERLNLQGQTEETFDGYLWEKTFPNILPKYCVSIKIFESKIPYLDPPDCKGSYVSIVQPRQDEDRALLFWTLKDNSTQFRVLWNDEELARCEISAGICEVYVP